MGATRTIVSKAMKDAAFRQRLLKDAKATLEQELGVKLPEGMTVRVQRELSENELQQISGGVISRDLQPIGGVLPSPINPLDPVLPGGGLAPLPGGKISAGATFGAYTGCCSSGRLF